MRPEQIRFSSYPHAFRVEISRCHNLECECTEVTFKLKETAADARPADGLLAFDVRIDGEAWKEVDPPPRSPQVAELVREFLDDYPARERASLKEACRKKKQTARRLREYRIDPQLIGERRLISFGEIISERGSIASGGRSCAFRFEHEGVEYLVDDLYCPNSDCHCREVNLLFWRCVPVEEPGEGIVTEECFMAKVPFDGRMEIVKTYDCPLRSAEEIYSTWWKRERGELDRLEWRYQKVREIARRSAPPRPKTALRPDLLPERPVRSGSRVGRNDRCPCGSGKKYKRCCGQPTRQHKT